MARSNDDLTLDGNAVGGTLSELFGEDLTGAEGSCPDCGTAGPVGTLRAYTNGPGIVLRCPACDAVQLVIVRTPRGLRHTARRRLGRS